MGTHDEATMAKCVNNGHARDPTLVRTRVTRTQCQLTQETSWAYQNACITQGFGC
jgi:hypothetical protein